MGNRINTVMQTCFFAISGVLPRDEAIQKIKESIEKTYGKKGADVVRKNQAAVDQTLANLFEIPVPSAPTTSRTSSAGGAPRGAGVRAERDRSAHRRQGRPDAGERCSRWMVPGPCPPPSGRSATSPTRSRPGKRTSASSATSACWSVPTPRFAPRSTTRPCLQDAPEGFKHLTFKGAEFKGQAYTVQVAPEDCTGCELCAMVCPAKDKSNPKRKALMMQLQRPLREAEAKRYAFFLDLAGGRPHEGQAGRQGLAVPPAAVRVLGRVHRLR